MSHHPEANILLEKKLDTLTGNSNKMDRQILRYMNAEHLGRSQ